MSAGAGWEVPRRHDSSEPAARRAGCRGMDTMHPPRAAPPHVNALCGASPNDDVSRHPRGHTPEGRVPVLTHGRPGRSPGRLVCVIQDCLGSKKRLLNRINAQLSRLEETVKR